MPTAAMNMPVAQAIILLSHFRHVFAHLRETGIETGFHRFNLRPDGRTVAFEPRDRQGVVLFAHAGSLVAKAPEGKVPAAVVVSHRGD